MHYTPPMDIEFPDGFGGVCPGFFSCSRQACMDAEESAAEAAYERRMEGP
jgi:hypothetical protein